MLKSNTAANTAARAMRMAQVLNRTRLRHLQMIIAIAEHGSILSAAHALGLSQPAISKALQEVEDILGVRLFDRMPRGVVINLYGKSLLERSRLIVAELERLVDDIGRMRDGASGTVVLGALPTAAAGILPVALRRLKASHPGLDVRVIQARTTELLPQLESGRLDLIVGRLYEVEGAHDLRYEVLYHEPISVLARAEHPILVSGDASLEAVSRYEMVLPSLEHRLGQEVDDMLVGSGVQVSPNCLRSSSTSLIRELLLSGDTLAILPRMMMCGDLLRGLIKVVPLALSSGVRPAGVITLRHRERLAAVDALIGCLKEYAAELRNTGLLS